MSYTIGPQQGSQSGLSTSLAPPVPMLNALNDQLAGICDEIGMLGRRLHDLADRIIGTRPEEAVAKETVPPSGSVMQTFERNVQTLLKVRQYLLDAVERLERL